MARGEWSLGKIIDTYFKFGYGGDLYLGQVLSMKDADSKDFAILPAHWKDENDQLITTGVAHCFPSRNITQKTTILIAFWNCFLLKSFITRIS